MSFPNVPRDPGGIPFSSIYIPGTGWVALQGVTPTTDGSGNQSAPLSAALYGKVTNPGDTPLLLDSAGRAIVTVNSGTVTISNATPLGQQLTIASTSIVPASDSPAFPTKRSAAALFTTTQTAQGSGNSGDLAVGLYTELSIDINTTAQAGTSPTIQFFYERKGADNIYYVLWQSVVLTAAANTLSTSIGAGMAYNQSLGLTGRLRWVVGGTVSPNWTFTPNIYAK